MSDYRISTKQRADHERTLLACALQDLDIAREAIRTVQAPMIADPKLARAWSALRRVLNATAGPVDLLDALAAELGGETAAPSLVELHEIHDETPSAANWSYYAARVCEAYARSEAEEMLGESEKERNRDLSTVDLLTGVAQRARRLSDLVTGVAATPLLVDATDFANVDPPAPVLWREPAPDVRESDPADAVLSIGEIAILSSAGGLGKSTITLEIASAAVRITKSSYGAACGLRVAAGPVVVVSYEDSPVRIADRLAWTDHDQPGIHLWPDPMPLWVADVERRGDSRPGSCWDRLWRAVKETHAQLVVIDPVSAALADVSTTEPGPVRAFLRELSREAAPNKAAGWAGCGVLLVAHDTKSARDAIRRGDDPGAGVVAGSAAWYDGARGVLALMRDPREGSEDRLLECVKANYGRTGWGARLGERQRDGAFHGLELIEPLDREEIAGAKKKQKGKATDTGKASEEEENPFE